MLNLRLDKNNASILIYKRTLWVGFDTAVLFFFLYKKILDKS